ncbi:MAG: DUF2330 domain-containing protein [Myxococcota bacterium]
MRVAWLLGAAVVALLPSSTRAFCGFYVGGADASLYNDATMVVLMRDGTKTVLSMQNNYEGPPEAFALVVPVPEVLQEENVRTLPRSIFERVDRLAAPRLVEYWEQDPCGPGWYGNATMRSVRRRRSASRGARHESARDLGVTIEAEFAVGEYDIVILGAEDSSGLETWLQQERYNIPDGASSVLNPYVQLGTKFFVAKVNPRRVTFANGRAVLSPLRVHYNSDEFSLPVRLGLLNSRGQQDLIVHVLAKATRYEVANYPNVTIPTNLTVEPDVAERFGSFYRTLYDQVVTENPGAVVTEYSWRATNCDPCPTTPLQPNELATLGADVIDARTTVAVDDDEADDPLRLTENPYTGEPIPRRPRRSRRPRRRSRWAPSSEYTLTRMHYRYGPDDLDRDLVFRAAPAIIGGRGTPDASGLLQEKHASPAPGANNFQGRYIMLHRWEGAVACANPQRGRWGGRPGSATPITRPSPSAFDPVVAATPVPLRRSVIASDHPFLSIRATPAANLAVGVLPGTEPATPEPVPMEEVAEPTPAAEPTPTPTPTPAVTPTTTPTPAASNDGFCSAASTHSSSLAVVFGLLLLRRRRPIRIS